MFTHEIYESSDYVKNKIRDYTDEIGVKEFAGYSRSKYPFAFMRIGQSFAIPLDYDISNAVRNAASYYGRKTGKKFSMIKHVEFNCIEVARVK